MSRRFDPDSRDDFPLSDLTGLLKDKMPRAALALASAKAMQPAVSSLYAKLKSRTTYTVKIAGSDPSFAELHAWVLDMLPSARQRALTAYTSFGRQLFRRYDPEEDWPSRSAVELLLAYDGTRSQMLKIGGHRVQVHVREYDQPSPSSGFRPPEMTFTMWSATARDTVLSEIRRVLREATERKRRPGFKLLDGFGEWESLSDLPPRALDSVILPHGQLERITADLGQFLAAEQEYLRRAVPWHRGYLFTGEPGSGKTSTARALASHFGMDVWYLPLRDVKRDAQLLRTVTRIPPKSVLLLEDADVFSAATTRDDAREVTLSGLLNALDGVITPHGLVTILTTNSPQSVDPALIRPGRIDMTETFGALEPEQARRLLARWYGSDVSGKVSGAVLDGVTAADLVEACKRSPSPDGVVSSLAQARSQALERPARVQGVLWGDVLEED